MPLRCRIMLKKNEEKIMHPSEKRRQGYLAYFKDGVYDALVYGQMDDIRRSSAYYKQGYDFGLVLFNDTDLTNNLEEDKKIPSA